MAKISLNNDVWKYWHQKLVIFTELINSLSTGLYFHCLKEINYFLKKQQNSFNNKLHLQNFISIRKKCKPLLFLDFGQNILTAEPYLSWVRKLNALNSRRIKNVSHL